MRSRPIIGGLLVTLIVALLPSMASARNPRGAVSTGGPYIGACPVTVGTLTLAATTPRSTGISPLLVFFDATATTDSATLGGANNPFQDVTYTWTFGDAEASGTGKWAYGSNPGNNSKNTATGAIAAHLYITAGVDEPHTATVTANDGTNTASCTVPVTAYDPAGSNGFPGTATTCVAQSTLPVAGSGGCPSGAAVATQASYATALGSYFGNGKQVLFHCGDTFTGDNVTITGIKATVGAYGGCEGTQTSRPIFSDTSTNNQVEIGAGSGDIRVSDISFNGNGTALNAMGTNAFVTQAIPYQVTMWNLQSTGSASSAFGTFESAQWGFIGSSVLNAQGIGVFFNSGANNASQWIGTFPNINYLAVMGDFVSGIGCCSSSGGIEAMRTASCRLCLYENNTIENANNTGGVFKFNCSNTYHGGNPWTGYWCELIEISDNLFTGNSGGILSDIAPENGVYDERERNIVIERNVYNSPTNACCETLLYLTGQNFTVRDNAFYMPANGGTYPVNGVTIGQRGSGNLVTTQYMEVYNDTCFAPNAKGTNGISGSGQLCVEIGTSVFTNAAAINSFCQNILFYEPVTVTGPACHSTGGSGNTASNNTATVTNSPAFTNGGGSYLLISDFKPIANYTGGTSVPVLYDAILSPTNPYGAPWSPTWDLGTVHH